MTRKSSRNAAMSNRPFRFEVLSGDHAPASFRCGEEALDRYLRQFTGQDMKRRVATVFVLVDNTNGRLVGFYTLSSFSVRPSGLPEDAQKRLPRYPEVPAVLLGRLARDETYRGRGCGALLLVDALRRALATTSQVAAFAVVVDAKTDTAAAFYRRFGFTPFQDTPARWFLPMRTIQDLMVRDGAPVPDSTSA